VVGNLYKGGFNMPVMSCKQGGKPGFKWGDSGKCYTYTANDPVSRAKARNKAAQQGRAIKSAQAKQK
jgi:hypothetical protein